MLRNPRKLVQTLMLGGAALCPAIDLQAQGPARVGVIRVSDGAMAPVADPISSGGYATGTGGVVQGNCPDCYGNQGHRHPHLHRLFQEHYGKRPADYGYALPARNPITRYGVQYSSHLPQAWYGTPGVAADASYPMVYQPTDTTQLGFYYQHAPSWQPQPWRLPARPVPQQWHSYIEPSGHFGHGHFGHHGHSGYNSSCPHCQQQGGIMSPASPTMQGAPTPLPETPSNLPASPDLMNEELPPEPINQSAESMHIRRAAF